YFENIAYHLKSTAVGMGVTLKHLFQTGKGAEKHGIYCYQYPDEGVERMREEVSERHRGIHFLEPSKCIMCLMCSKVCPVQCIVIEGVRLGKDQLLSRFTIDYSKCLFCGLCTEPCPSDCIHHGREWDYSGFSRTTLVKDMLRNRVYTPAAHQEYLAAHDEAKLIEAEFKKIAAAEKAKAAAAAPKPAAPAAAAKPAAPAAPAQAKAAAPVAPAPVQAVLAPAPKVEPPPVVQQRAPELGARTEAVPIPPTLATPELRKNTEKLPQRDVPRPAPLPPVAPPAKPAPSLSPAPLSLEPELAPEPELNPDADEEKLN
ncbi:MAG: 4Fe-4S binding protein, partial [Planctomycetes bacterium]|nr:4Fe-4S binding protein [Planctomycetota bacterium]